jgi:hypothetical protein
MRKFLGIGVVLSAASLTGSLGVANAQTGAAGQAGRGTTSVGRPQTPSPNNLEQQAVEAAGVNNTAGSANAAPGQATGAVPGQPAGGMPAPGTTTTPPANTSQAPTMTGTAPNPAGAAAGSPGTVTNNAPNLYQAGTYTGATPGYTNRTMPNMAGYNSVNPMATTMAPGYYYAGTAGMPYATYSNPGYSSGYVYPGYNTTTYQTYNVRPRRGLFGRRNRVAYPVSPYGYNTYSNGYSSPYGYSSYATTTYYSAPGGYGYGGYRN